MKLYNNLIEEVEKGLQGKNGVIPFPVAKLDDYIDIAKNTTYLLVGDTGSGKSTLAHDILLNIMDYYYENRTDKLKLTCIYFGMERKQYNYTAKWVSRLIYMAEGVLITSKKILGRQKKRDRVTGKFTKDYDLLTPEEFEKVKKYTLILQKWQDDGTFICVEGTQNPVGIAKYIEKFAKENGTVVPRAEGIITKETYRANHPNHIVLIAVDYVGVLDKMKDEDKKKDRLDIFSATMRKSRDLYGFSPVPIQQLSRQVNDSTRLKLNDVKPRLSDIADTSELARDADVVIAIFEPFRYLPEDVENDLLGYNLRKLKDKKGYKYYRTLHILKNSFDSDGIIMGCAFMPQIGTILPMPHPANMMEDDDYEWITNTSYFYNKKGKR